jgi:hypothetical protein
MGVHEGVELLLGYRFALRVSGNPFSTINRESGSSQSGSFHRCLAKHIRMGYLFRQSHALYFGSKLLGKLDRREIWFSGHSNRTDYEKN